MGRGSKALSGLGTGLAEVGGLLVSNKLMEMREQALARMREEYGLKEQAMADARHKETLGMEGKKLDEDTRHNKAMEGISKITATAKDKPAMEKLRMPLRDDDGSVVMQEKLDPLTSKVIGQEPVMIDYWVERDPSAPGGMKILGKVEGETPPTEDKGKSFFDQFILQTPTSQAPSQVPTGTLSGINGSLPKNKGPFEQFTPTMISGSRG